MIGSGDISNAPCTWREGVTQLQGTGSIPDSDRKRIRGGATCEWIGRRCAVVARNKVRAITIEVFVLEAVRLTHHCDEGANHGFLYAQAVRIHPRIGSHHWSRTRAAC